MSRHTLKVSRTVDEGFTLEDLVAFISHAQRQGHRLDARVRVRVRNAFHTDGGLIKTITVEQVETFFGLLDEGKEEISGV